MLTLEQQQVVDTVCSSIGEGKIIAVEAVAGSGKTSTAKVGENDILESLNIVIEVDT